MIWKMDKFCSTLFNITRSSDVWSACTMDAATWWREPASGGVTLAIRCGKKGLIGLGKTPDGQTNVSTQKAEQDTGQPGIGSTIPCPTTGPRLSWRGKFWKISFPAKSTSCSRVSQLTYIFGFIILSTGDWARYMQWQSHHSLVKNWRCRASFRFLAFFSSAICPT